MVSAVIIWLVVVALIGQIECGYNSYNEKAIVRYLNEGYHHPDLGSYVINPYPRDIIPSGPPVNIQCPAAAPRRIHVKTGSAGRPHINVVAPPNPTPVTVQCPHTAGNHIVVHGAPNPQPIITYDHKPSYQHPYISTHPYSGRLYSRYFFNPYGNKISYNNRYEHY